MARLIGIDIRKNHVRAVLLRTSRRPTIERMLEADVALLGTLEDTVRACVGPLLDAHVEGLAVAVEGDQAFIRRLELPSSAKKQISERPPRRPAAAPPPAKARPPSGSSSHCPPPPPLRATFSSRCFTRKTPPRWLAPPASTWPAPRVPSPSAAPSGT